MSWHTCGILIKADYSDDYPALLEKLGLGAATPGEMVSFDEASSSSCEGVAIGTLGGWTSIWGNFVLLMIDDDAVTTISKNADVFQLLLEGASCTAGFTFHSGGKLVRDWMRQEDNVVKDVGKPLPLEETAFKEADDEQAVLQLASAMTIQVQNWHFTKFQTFNLSDDVLFGE
ncbi:hypothetical protein NA78x_003452 [Anatilimnocola sp. NA78]|uniref:hypothetical protein n=1 Tax=Anatilimnocola sp. NA78 TaxID=3415683 RepID=UPI003CE46D22